MRIDDAKVSKVSTVEFRNNFGDAVNRVAYGREILILKRRGKEVAAVISIELFDKLTGRNKPHI